MTITTIGLDLAKSIFQVCRAVTNQAIGAPAYC